MSLMGDRISQKRKEKGMTMEELGNALGLQASAINKYEKGLVENIKRPVIKEMARVLECDPVWLMGFDVEDIKPAADYAINLTEDEQLLIEAYRSNDETYRKMIEIIIFSLKKSKEE